MASASSSSSDMEGPATLNFEIVNENKSNNNIQVYDLANRENDFWAQPQEEIFYSPQPLSALVGPLPFSNTLYIDGLHYMPTDADMIFGDLDSDDESLEPFQIEIVNDTSSETETEDDIDVFSELESPSSTSSLDSTTTEEPVIEIVDETDMFADLWSPFSLDQDITEEPVAENVDDTDIFTYFRSPSRTSSLDRDATEVYPLIQSDGTRTVIEESLNVIREYEIVRDGEILVIDGRSTAVEPRDFAIRSSHWDRLPSSCFSDSKTSLTQPVGQAACTSDVPTSEDDEADFLHTRVAEEKLTPKWDNITDDARPSLGASEPGSWRRNVESQSVDIQILLRQALKDLNHIYHINENWEPRAVPDDWTEHAREERVDQSTSGSQIPWDADLNPVSGNRDTINRWLYQNDRQGVDPVSAFPYNSYCDRNQEFIPAIDPRLCQSAVEMFTTNNKRKIEEIECEVLESRSDSFLTNHQITKAKRRRIYQTNDQGEDDITYFHHSSHSSNNDESLPAVEPRLSKSAIEMGTAKRKRKLDELDNKVLKSQSETCLMNRQTARPKRRRI